MNIESTVKKIKILFSLSILSVTLVIFVGMRVMKESVYVSTRYIGMAFNYLKYEAENLNRQGLAQAASVALFDSNQLSYTRDYARSVPVLAYHRVVESSDGANVTAENFKDQMFALKEAGYRTVKLSDLEAFLRGDKYLPEKSIVLTFDDGAKDSFYPVDPILKALDFDAVNFVIGKHSVKDDLENRDGYYLNRDELKAMLRSGRWEIGSHSWDCHGQIPVAETGERGYCLTSRLWLADQSRLETETEYLARVTGDLALAKRKLESELETKISSFAFPFGDFGYESKNLENASTTLAQATDRFYAMNFYQPFVGESTENRPNPEAASHLVGRIKVSPEWSGQDLIKKIEEGVQ